MNTSKQTKAGYGLIAILGTALAMGPMAPTFAQDLMGRDVALRYGRHAPDTEQGAARLLKRIEGAASRVCAPLDHGDLASRANAKDCTTQVTAAAVYKVNHPMLVAVYNSKQVTTPSVASLQKE